jgi:5,10-methylene-tetrahydrofolate dehydrogenase/methenyl tetrahydrofolate cyclohydrolase
MTEPIEKKKRRSKAQVLEDKANVEKALAEASKKIDAAIIAVSKPKRVAKPKTIPIEAVVEVPQEKTEDKCCGGCVGGCEPPKPTLWERVQKWFKA